MPLVLKDKYHESKLPLYSDAFFEASVFSKNSFIVTAEKNKMILQENIFTFHHQISNYMYWIHC